MAYLTAEEIITRAKAEAIGSTSSALTALQDTQLIERVEQINAQFVQAAYTRQNKDGWSWMRKTTNLSSKAHTTLNGALSAGAASVVLTSGTDFDSSGRIVIETSKGALDFVDYTSKATHTLTVSAVSGAETVSIAHATGERVEKLYALPSDYSKTRTLYVNSTPYYYEKADRFPNPGTFTTYGTYLFLPRGLGAQDLTLQYDKAAATIDGLTDSTDIPTEYQRYPIEMLKAHIYAIRRKREDIQLSYELAEQALQTALDMDNQPLTASQGIPLPY